MEHFDWGHIVNYIIRIFIELDYVFIYLFYFYFMISLSPFNIFQLHGGEVTIMHACCHSIVKFLLLKKWQYLGVSLRILTTI